MSTSLVYHHLTLYSLFLIMSFDQSPITDASDGKSTPGMHQNVTQLTSPQTLSINQML
jgi:hypothetical protein